MVFLAASTPGRLDFANLLLFHNAGITGRRVLRAARAAGFPTLCLPLLDEATLSLGRKFPRAGSVECVHERIARRMR